jgi:hypothetical protein
VNKEETKMNMETLRDKPLAIVGPVLKEAYKLNARGVTGNVVNTWYLNHLIKSVTKEVPDDPNAAKAVEELLNWGRNNPQELEILIARRSPGTAARLAVSYKRRLCKEAEKFVLQKAGDRATLLDYCGHFGIVLDDLTKVTMKAAFNEDSWREKNYIKKMEQTKVTVRGFLAQMVNVGRIDPNITVKELIETLEVRS